MAPALRMTRSIKEKLPIFFIPYWSKMRLFADVVRIRVETDTPLYTSWLGDRITCPTHAGLAFESDQPRLSLGFRLYGPPVDQALILACYGGLFVRLYN